MNVQASVPDTLTIIFLDVTEADAALVQAPDGHPTPNSGRYPYRPGAGSYIIQTG